MKKKAINLLTTTEHYDTINRRISFFRRIVLFFAIVLFLIITALFFLQFSQDQKLQSLADDKKSSLEFLTTKKVDEAKLIYIANKVKALDTFLSDDAQFYPYYNLLVNALKTSTDEASLSSVAIEKNREVKFSLIFKDFQEMTNAFKVIESESFLKNFETLTLSHFESTGKESSFEILFEGKFKKINENRN